MSSEEWLTLIENCFNFKYTDIINDDCSDLMYLSWVCGISGIHILWHILGNVFHSTFINDFLLLSRFYVFIFI